MYLANLVKFQGLGGKDEGWMDVIRHLILPPKNFREAVSGARAAKWPIETFSIAYCGALHLIKVALLHNYRGVPIARNRRHVLSGL